MLGFPPPNLKTKLSFSRKLQKVSLPKVKYNVHKLQNYVPDLTNKENCPHLQDAPTQQTFSSCDLLILYFYMLTSSLHLGVIQDVKYVNGNVCGIDWKPHR